MKVHPVLVACVAFASLFSGCTSSGSSPQRIERHAWVTGLKPEKAARYHELHKAVWPGVEATLKACHVRSFSVYVREIDGKTYLFAFLEYDGKDFAADMKRMGDDPETQRWWKETDPCQSPLPDAAAAGKTWSDTKEIYRLD